MIKYLRQHGFGSQLTIKSADPLVNQNAKKISKTLEKKKKLNFNNINSPFISEDHKLIGRILTHVQRVRIRPNKLNYLTH